MRIWTLALALALAGGVYASDLDDHYTQLKEIDAKKDPDAVMRLALETSKLARAAVAEAQPSDASAVADWKQRVEYAKEVDHFVEYSLASTAIATADETKMEGLVDALIELNPKSEYLTLCSSTYLAAKAKQGTDKQLAAAQKLLTANANNEDALDVLANGYIGSSADRAGGYATRLLTVMKAKAKPEGVVEADWEKKKSSMLGDGYYVAGAAACTKGSWIDCDRNLKLAVPFVNKDPRVLGITYFYLGLADYQIGKATGDRTKIQEGERYSEQSSAIPGPMQQKAAANAQSMKAELAAPRR